jgi:hypothetical protein
MKKANKPEKAALLCRKKFLYYFPRGFNDPKYCAWERNYKWDAQLQWEMQLNSAEFKKLLDSGSYAEIANRAVRIETKTNLLFSFEKMALRDAVKTVAGAKLFATGLYEFLYAGIAEKKSFDMLSNMLASLPRKQTRVHTWPLQTVFGFIAQPGQHIFLKPRVTQASAKNYNFPFEYKSKPNWETYQSLLAFAETIRKNNMDLRPRDFIDLQSFIWVNGSDEYD